MFASKDAFFTNNSGYTIARSVRLRSSASAYFSRTPATTTNRQIWTWSGWVKRGELGANEATLFSSRVSSTYTQFSFRNSGSPTPNQFLLQSRTGASEEITLVTTQVFRDPSAWYHIVVAVDTTQATSTNRVKIYSNGSQITSFSTSTYPSQNLNTMVNFAQAHAIGNDASGGSLFGGYLTEINFIDGQALTPSSFGETDSITGVWKAKKYGGTYGTNGFYLNFSDNSAATATAIGKDLSGNANNWTPNNISVTSGVTYDSMTDVPTLTSATAANYAVLNPINKQATSYYALSNGNLQFDYTASGSDIPSYGTICVSSGKWYFEGTYAVASGIANRGAIGITADVGALDSLGNNPASFGYRESGSKNSVSGGLQAYGASYAVNDVIGVALDMDAGTVTFYKNGASQGTAFSGLSGSFTAGVCGFTPCRWILNFGQRPFSYTPPTGFVALNTNNL